MPEPDNALAYGRVYDPNALDRFSRIDVMQGDGVGSSAEQPLAILITEPNTAKSLRTSHIPGSSSDKDTELSRMDAPVLTSCPTIKATQPYNRVTVQVIFDTQNNKPKCYTVYLKPDIIIQERNKPVFDQLLEHFLQQIGMQEITNFISS